MLQSRLGVKNTINDLEIKNIVYNFRKMTLGEQPYRDIFDTMIAPQKMMKKDVQSLSATLVELIIDVIMHHNGVAEQAKNVQSALQQFSNLDNQNNKDDCLMLIDFIEKMRKTIKSLKDQRIINRQSAKRLRNRVVMLQRLQGK